MAPRYSPIFLRHAAGPSIEGFALLTGIEAAIRGTLISVMPIAVYEALGDASRESRLYFLVGCCSLATGLMVPWLTRIVPRRWVYTLGTCFYLLGASLALHGGALATGFALLSLTLGTVTCFVCLNAYVLDYIPRLDLGRCQSVQMFYAATSWTLGPVLGVWLRGLWTPAPFALAFGFALALLASFWALRLGNGKAIVRAQRPAPNPLAYLGRFFAQPRLVLGWGFAVIRSCGWWVYVVYLPIFCVQNGLGDRVGGIALSLSNAMLYSTPVMLRFVQRVTVRIAVRTAFLCAGVLFLMASAASMLPWATLALMLAGSLFLVLLDVSAGLPFLMAVKPSERTEMAAIYSSFRDVSGILTPGVAWAILLAAPVSATFGACGLALLTAAGLALKLHPRLGAARPSRGATAQRS